MLFIQTEVTNIFQVEIIQKRSFFNLLGTRFAPKSIQTCSVRNLHVSNSMETQILFEILVFFAPITMLSPHPEVLLSIDYWTLPTLPSKTRYQPSIEEESKTII